MDVRTQTLLPPTPPSLAPLPPGLPLAPVQPPSVPPPSVPPQAWSPQPLTFAGRGVAVPFTTPALAGTRIRQGRSRGLELVLQNPSGGRGLYVVPWVGVPDLSQATLHDLQLHAAIQAALADGAVTPARVLAAARAVARGGAAGRAARAAAEAAIRAEQAALQAARRHLLTALLRHGDDEPDLAEVWALAASMPGIGLGPAAPGTVPHGIAQLVRLRDGMDAWADAHAEDAPIARMVQALADSAACHAAAALHAVQHGSDTAALFAAWRNAPDAMAEQAERPSWILDGWQLPCLLWAQSGGSSAALAELGQLAAPLPQQAAEWTGLPVDPGPAEALRRLMAQPAEHRPDARAAGSADLRGGVPVSDLVARNEQLRALAA